VRHHRDSEPDRGGQPFGAPRVEPLARRARGVPRPRPDQAIASLRGGGPGHTDAPPTGAPQPPEVDERRRFEVSLRREWGLAELDRSQSVVVVAGLRASDDASPQGIGEAIAEQFTEALRLAARTTDVIAGWGEGVFAVLLVGADETGATYFESRVREALTEPAWPLLGALDPSFGQASLAGSASAAAAFEKAEARMLAGRRRRSPGSARTRLPRGPSERRHARDGALADRVIEPADTGDFERHVQREWQRARWQDTDSVVIVAGLGAVVERPAGEQIVHEFTGALSVAARSTDILARLGAAEFAVLLIGCGRNEAEYFERRLRDALREPAWPTLARIELSLGRASVREAGSASGAIDDAEMAMLGTGWARGEQAPAD
jgi:GGDEF domain-containing protein